MEKNKYRKSALGFPQEGYWSAALRMLPVILMVCVVPLLVRQIRHENGLTDYPWFGIQLYTDEFFLAIKSIALTLLMFVMAGCVAVRLWKTKGKVVFAKILIPLFIYVFFAFLSACCSINKTYSFFGGFEHFETIWVLITYVLAVYYVLIYAQDELELQVVTDALCFGATMIGIIGTLQGLGYDILYSSWGQTLITSKEFREMGGVLTRYFEEKVAFATLYNPNYLGVFGSFMLPFLGMLFVYEKGIWRRIWHGGTVVLVFIAVLSSRSRSGLIATAIALGVALVFAVIKLLKWWYLALPAFGIAIATVLIVNAYNDNMLFERLENVLTPDDAEIEEVVSEDGTVIRKTGLMSMYTAQGGVVLEYNEFEMQITLYEVEDAYGMYAVDNKGNQVELLPNNDGTVFSFTHPAIKDIKVRPVYIGAKLGMQIDTGREWLFVYSDEKECYQYITGFGKESDMVMAESIGFENYQKLFSSRGYIWSRTIPLVKDHIFIGSGPDTFVLVFPQEDYVNMFEHDLEFQLVTKPHSWYLQVAVQTGLVSLVCLLVFYVWYAVWSLRLYAFKKLSSQTEAFGIAAFIGSIGYMISGISNDSMVVTAPVFWGMIGLGIAANVMVAKRRKQKESVEK